MTIPEKPSFSPLPLPDEPGLLGGWGKKLETTLTRFILDVYNAIVEPFQDMRDKAVTYFIDRLSEDARPLISPYLDRLDAIPNLPPDVKSIVNEMRGTPAIAALGALLPILLGVLGGIAFGLVQPIARLVGQETDSYVHSARMTPAEAFMAWRKGAISESDYHNHLSDGGWSEKLEEAWKTLLTPLLEIGDIGRLYVREDMSEAVFNTELTKRGYRTEGIERIKTLLHVIPPLTDIIQMAVREAFTPEIVQRFQLHAELPGEMVSWAKKQGLSVEWSKAYWASHWLLPSLTMGYEMLHRGEIKEKEMQMLIKAHDVSPFWRDKLLNISYSPFTRVDIRRMHKMGVVGVEEVYKNYKDLGYDHEKATKMTEFTIAFNQGTERDLTKTDIMYGYEVGYFSPGEADVLLIGLGYDQNESDYYKAKVDYKRYQAAVKETVKYIGQQYIANQIDQNEVYAQLGALNLPAEQMNRYIREWDLKKQAKTKRLTAERLTKFRKQGVITDSEFTSEMSGLGYSQRYISWFLDSLGKG